MIYAKMEDHLVNARDLVDENHEWFLSGHYPENKKNPNHPLHKILHKLRTPCCNAPLTLVYSQMEHRRPYFRHLKKSNCPLANADEYLNETHWIIIDALHWIFHHRKLRFFHLSRFHGLNFWEKLCLAHKTPDFRREVIMTQGSILKRADIVVGNLAIEVQCSSISKEEVKERERVYAAYGLKTLWIIGYPPGAKNKHNLVFPNKLSKPVQETCVKSIKLHIKFIRPNKANNKDKTRSFLLDGLKLNNSRQMLLTNAKVAAIYYEENFYYDFNWFTWYIEPSLQLPDKYPYQKRSFLVLSA